MVYIFLVVHDNPSIDHFFGGIDRHHLIGQIFQNMVPHLGSWYDNYRT